MKKEKRILNKTVLEPKREAIYISGWREQDEAMA